MSSAVLRESRRLEQRIAHVRQFRDAFRETLALANESWEDPVGAVTRRPSEANRATYNASLDRLAELAGTAVAAAGSVQPTSSRYGYSYNPLLQWRDAFRHRRGVASSTEVLDACDTVIGILTAHLEEVRAKEATLAYRVGRIVTFPQRARSAAGPGRAARELAFWGALLVELMAGVILLAIPFLVASVLG